VHRTCDHLLSIPMAGAVSSLNVSAAGAVVLYEAARQRRSAASSPASLVQESVQRSGIGVPRSGAQPKKQKGLGS
jgi:23S rRNA (guanosine2251-2'-O)-methyltransferase